MKIVEKGQEVTRVHFWEKLCVLVLVSTYGMAAVAKGTTLGEVRDVLYASYLFSGAAAEWAALFLVLAEAMTAVLLLRKGTRAAGMCAAIALSSAFIGFAVWRLSANIGVPCSCFGALLKIPPGYTLPLNVGLLSLAILLLRAQPRAGVANSAQEMTL